MEVLPHPDPTETVDDYGLTPDERLEHDRHVADIKSAHRTTIEAVVRLGVLLLAFRAFRLHTPRHERSRSWAQACEDDLELEVSSAYDFMDVARVDRALREAGREPLTAVSHALAVAQDGGRDDPGLVVERVETGRALAEAEGRRPAARHYEAAREGHPGPEARALQDAIAELEGFHAAVESRDDLGDGLHVAFPVSGERRVEPWSDRVPDEWPDGAGPVGLAPVRLDPVAGLTWPVVLPGGTAATAWDLPDSPSCVVYFPDRLRSTTARSMGRSQTVLVAPGVDVLHNGVPARVVREIGAAIGADPSRLYLVLTRSVRRVAEAGLPINAVIVVSARSAEEVDRVAADVRAVGGEDAPAFAVLLRGLASAPAEGLNDALDAFDWVLVRGEDTTWEALEAVYAAVPGDRLHVSKEVRARPEANPLLARLPAPAPRPDRAAVPVAVTRSPGGPALPAR